MSYFRRCLHTIRNLGIIAHIDAGKTTTTERMLYFAGVTKRIGNVDTGDTVTDYLEAERERGITIQSAAISFNWQKHKINLIDTPGHADFNFEVVRSLRVLDGTVLILDAVAGVEALTEKNFNLANDWKIPKIVYINKMDRPGAGFSRTFKEVISKLKIRALPLNIPFFEGEEFKGVIDVLNGKKLVYLNQEGTEVDVSDHDTSEARQSIIEQLSDLDADILETFIEKDDVPNEMLVNSIKALTHSNQVVPVFCGSSFRNIGVQPLLDGIIQYLPSPQKNDDELVKMLAFKVRQDPQRGPLVFVRVYSGSLKKGSTVYNVTTKKTEKISKLLRMQADEPVDINIANEGEIAVLSGTNSIRTGDTLIAHPSKLNGIGNLTPEQKSEVLKPIEVPPPVFVRRISPKGPGDVRLMDSALEILLREDPSLHISYDEDAGQHLLSGMGELHLEIAINRLVDDLKARIDVGDLLITYKESINSNVLCEKSVTDMDAHGLPTKVDVKIQRSTGKTSNLIDSNNVVTNFRRHPMLRHREVHDQCIYGIIPVLAKGGQIARNALFGLHFDISVEVSPESNTLDLITPLVRKACTEALNELDNAQYVLLEPVMDVSVKVPKRYLATVMADLTNLRRGTIAALNENEDSHDGDIDYNELASNAWAPKDYTMHLSNHEDATYQLVQLTAKVPLRTMIGYLSSLRSMTQGRGTFEMSFSEFAEVSPQDAGFA